MSEPDARVDVNVNIRSGSSESDSGTEEVGTIKIVRTKTTRYRSYDDIEAPAGHQVGWYKDEYGDELDLEEGFVAVVAGQLVGDDRVMRAGETLTFQPAPKDRGRK